MTRIAYADPPYPATHPRHYGRGPGETGKHPTVNHRLLVAYLTTFDGWALSTSTTGLAEVLPYCPPRTRVAAWCRRWVATFPTVSPTYAWEPVVFVPARRARRGTRDWLNADLAAGSREYRGFTGQKPSAFTAWVLELVGAQSEDTIEDVFPGSGAVTDAIAAWRNRLPFPGDDADQLELLA